MHLTNMSIIHWICRLLRLNLDKMNTTTIQGYLLLFLFILFLLIIIKALFGINYTWENWHLVRYGACVGILVIFRIVKVSEGVISFGASAMPFFGNGSVVDRCHWERNLFMRVRSEFFAIVGCYRTSAFFKVDWRSFSERGLAFFNRVNSVLESLEILKW